MYLSRKKKMHFTWHQEHTLFTQRKFFRTSERQVEKKLMEFYFTNIYRDRYIYLWLKPIRLSHTLSSLHYRSPHACLHHVNRRPQRLANNNTDVRLQQESASVSMSVTYHDLAPTSSAQCVATSLLLTLKSSNSSSGCQSSTKPTLDVRVTTPTVKSTDSCT